MRSVGVLLLWASLLLAEDSLDVAVDR